MNVKTEGRGEYEIKKNRESATNRFNNKFNLNFPIPKHSFVFQIFQPHDELFFELKGDSISI